MEFLKKTLFIGCGDGSEILPLAHDKSHLLVGLEPIGVLYDSAKALLAPYENVSVVKSSIQSWKNKHYETDFNHIYMIFPPPVILSEQAESIINRIYELLSENNGVFCLISEVTISGWPDFSDVESLKRFLEILGDGRFHLSVTEKSFDMLPESAKITHCGELFKNHNIKNYTVVYSQKRST